MKTEKEISEEDFSECLTDDHYVCLFEKKSAKLFVNVTVGTKAVCFSVFNMKTHNEEKFDLLAEAVSVYNNLP